MSIVKNIYTCGTSFTVGGGFEFWKDDKRKTAYSNLGEEISQHNFSYPGQLEKIINDDNINVINLAKSGYGNELMYQEVYKIVNSSDFNKETDVFFLEFSHLGRTELFSRKINKRIILNWNQIFSSDKKIKEPIAFEFNGWAETYWKDDTKEGILRIKLEKEYSLFFQKYINNFDYKKSLRVMSNNSITFISYLLQKGIKFWFTQPPLSIEPRYFEKLNWDSKLIDFDKESRGFMLDFALFSFNGAGTITHETNGYIEDGHTGIVGNKVIAIKLYNHLIKNGLISNSMIDIDYSELNRISNIIKNNVLNTENII